MHHRILTGACDLILYPIRGFREWGLPGGFLNLDDESESESDNFDIFQIPFSRVSQLLSVPGHCAPPPHAHTHTETHATVATVPPPPRTLYVPCAVLSIVLMRCGC